MHYHKYKDLSPEETVMKAKAILSSLGVEMKETLHHHAENLYSMRLQDDKLGWGINGKGTTEAYCRASAYGEAMERLQNLHLPDYLVDLQDDKVKTFRGFLFYLDETMHSIKGSTSLLSEVFADMRASFYDSDGNYPEDNILIDTWVNWKGCSEFNYIPFYSVKRGDSIELPYEIIRRICRSNGIASGNTPEEALCQALSEVMERYVQERLFVNELTPPEIPVNYIRKMCPELLNTIHEIEGKGSFKMLIFDGTLGKEIPVVCTVLIDYMNQRYRIKFGSHPLFSIALERCLTELAQGNDFSETCNEKQMTKWNRDNQHNWDSLYNWSITFRSNEGSIPSSVFFTKPSWDFIEWTKQTDFTNKKGSMQLIDLCLALAPDVYIRNNSFLGFPSVRVYIPGVSPAHKFNPLGKRTLITKKMRDVLNYFPFYVDTISDDTKQNLIEIFKGDYHYTYIEKLGVSVPVLLGALYADLGDIKMAVQALHEESKPTKFIEAAIRELEMREDGISQENRDRMLGIFFGNKFRTYISLNWRGKNITGGLFDPFRLNKLRGIKAKDNRVELSKNISALYYNLKNAMVANPISQNEIGRLIEEWKREAIDRIEILR